MHRQPCMKVHTVPVKKRGFLIMKSFDIFLFMKTGTKINKTRGRKGSLLILVMVIMAVALILITSAMTITVAARSHYNKAAVMDQSHLTAMSGAKLIGDAVQKGTITTAQLELMASSVPPTKYYLTGSSSVAPGLAGTSSSSASYTMAEFGYSNATKDYITVKVTTHIDNTAVTGSATDESATLFLKYTPVVIPDGFGAAVAISGSGQLPSIHAKTTSTAKSSFVIVSGPTLTANNGSAEYEGDLIITGNTALGNIVKVDGNVVLYGPNAGLNGSGTNSSGTWVGSNMPTVKSTSYFLDLRMTANGGQTYYTGNRTQSLSETFSPAAILIKDSNMNFGDGNIFNSIKPASSKIFTVGTGKVTLSGSTVTSSSGNFVVQALTAASTADQTKMNSLITYYTDPSGLVQTALNYVKPATRAAMNTKLGIDPSYGVSKTGSALKTALDAAGVVPINVNSLTSSQTYTGSAYYIDTSSNPSLMQALTFNCSTNDINLYIIGTKPLSLGYNNSGSIRFTRSAGSTGIGKIIFLEDTASIDFGSSDGSGGYPGITGAGTPDRYTKTPAAMITDGSEPYLYIYGFNNTININTPKYLEAYVGLFGQDPISGGTVTIGSGCSVYTYARFNVYKLVAGGGDGTGLVYCPAPGENDSTTNKNKYQISGYITN